MGSLPSGCAFHLHRPQQRPGHQCWDHERDYLSTEIIPCRRADIESLQTQKETVGHDTLIWIDTNYPRLHTTIPTEPSTQWALDATSKAVRLDQVWMVGNDRRPAATTGSPRRTPSHAGEAATHEPEARGKSHRLSASALATPARMAEGERKEAAMTGRSPSFTRCHHSASSVDSLKK